MNKLESIFVIFVVCTIPLTGYVIGNEFDKEIQFEKKYCTTDDFPSPSDCRYSKSDVEQMVEFAFDKRLDGEVWVTFYCNITFNWNNNSKENIPSVSRLCEVDGEIDRVTQTWISDTIVKKIDELRLQSLGSMSKN